MKIIAIETSSVQGGVAILEMKNDSVSFQAELALQHGLVHGQLLVPALDKMLKKAGWGKDEIELVAVDIGPGSYTGLRVGLAIAKTISYVLKAKIIGVPALDVLARNIRASGSYKYICPIIDARWNQVYTAIYETSAGGYKRQTDYLAIPPEDLVKSISRRKGDILLLGDGLRAYKDMFRRFAARAKLADERFWPPRAGNVARLAYESYKAGVRNEPIKLLPLYLRPTEAEVNLKIKNRRKNRTNEKISHLVRG